MKEESETERRSGDLDPTFVDGQLRILSLAISTHAIDRFRERCGVVYENSKLLKQNTVCATKIYVIYCRGCAVDVNDKELRPWFIHATLQDCEELIFDKSTRIVLIVKDCGDYKVVKTVFRAVCHICGKKECNHLRKFRREQNKKDKLEKKERNNVKFSKPESIVICSGVQYTCPGCDKKFYTSDPQSPMCCPWCKCEKIIKQDGHHHHSS